MGFYSAGLEVVMQWDVLLMLMLGTLAGLMVGALPGLSPTMAIAVFSPLTIQMDLIPALAILLGIYCGGMYGGSIGAILLNIPGHAGAVLTAVEGVPLRSKNGTANTMGLAVTSSVIGGMFSVVVLVLLAPMIAKLALEFTFAEYFAIAVFGLILVSYIGQGSRLKALIAALAGVFISLIGTDPIFGFARYTFDNPYLRDGLHIVPVFVGLFGLSELLMALLRGSHSVKSSDINDETRLRRKGSALLLGDLRKRFMTLVRGSFIGSFIGAAPGTGGTVASIVAYGVERGVSKEPEEFGKGSKQGLMAAESANNATTGGAMIPLLTLGIPGDAVTAILIGTFLLHGVTPGPNLFEQSPQTVSAIFLLIALANIAFFVPGLTWAVSLGRILNKMPRELLIVGVMALCVVGTYSVRGHAMDVYLMVGFGLLGVIMNRHGYSRVPLVLGFILGSIAENNFRRALVLGQGDYSEFFSRPISGVFLGLSLLLVVSPLIRSAFRRRQGVKTDG